MQEIDKIEYPPKNHAQTNLPAPNNSHGDISYKLLGLFLVLVLGFASLGIIAGSLMLNSIAKEIEQAVLQHKNNLRSNSSYAIDYLSESGIYNRAIDLKDPLLQQRKLVINSSIHEQTAWRISRKLLYLNAQNPKQPIDLYLSTPGGWYNSAFSIIDTFYSISAPVNVHCLGNCHSSGTLIMAMATGLRTAAPQAQFSLHIYYAGFSAKQTADQYEEPADRVNRFYLEHSQVPKKWLPLKDDKTYYLSAAKALEFALIDKIAAPTFKPKQQRQVAKAAAKANEETKKAASE